MTIHLPENLESSILAAVRSGHFDSVDEAARLLLDKCQPTNPARTLTLDELDRQMLADGLMSQLPNAAEDIDDEDEAPIAIEGEPLSETIIRERR